ncbi:MAG: hypothetical protein D6722_06820 [Bacteroidetes bacterium]|nr:MAG: hypothetical protein D6722_06820 [Bacteroidota bacterium]
MNRWLAIVLIIGACGPMQGWAQQAPLQVGLSLTANAYSGDYTEPATAFQRVYPGGHFSVQKENGQALRVSLTGGFGGFSDQYEGRFPPLPQGVDPPTFVATRFVYGDLRLTYRFFPGGKLQPYVSAGAGLIVFAPRDAEGRRLLIQSDTRLEGETYNTVIPQLPASVGLRYRLHPILRVGLGYTYRFVPTDYLDNTGQAGTRAGFDALHALDIGLDFILGTPPDPR